MNTDKNRASSPRRKFKGILSLVLSVCICAHLWLVPGQAQDRDLVANLAMGRVVLCVSEGGIIVGADEPPRGTAEPGSLLPPIVPLGGSRMAAFLGAVEWVSPGTSLQTLRLDRELAQVLGQTQRPRLGNTPQEGVASDIEMIGVGVLEKLRTVTADLHSKIDLKPDEPLLQIILADYLENYGPEVWLLRYRVAQEALRGDYWRTRILRPSYTQLYPPEKGQPRTLMEVRYPADDSEPRLLDLISGPDARMTAIRSSDSHLAKAAEGLAKGQSHKIPTADAANLLRTVLTAITPADSKLSLGVLEEHRGFQWVLAPPEPPKKVEEGKPREPGAPTLRKPPH